MANIEQFNKIADNYQSELRLKLFDIFQTELNLMGVSGQVLDFGCGTGNLGISIAANCESIYLLEPSAAMRAIISQKLDEEGIDNCYISSLNLEAGEKLDASFDYIIVAQVLLHIPQYLQLIEQLVANLNFKGQLVIFDYLKNNDVHSEIVHNGFDLEQLIADTESMGLKVVSSKLLFEADNLLLGGYGQLFMLSLENTN